MRSPLKRIIAVALAWALLAVPAGGGAQGWPATTGQPDPIQTIQTIQWRNMQWIQSIQARNNDLLRRHSILMDRYRSQLGSMRSLAAPGQVVRVPMPSTQVPFSDAARRLSDMRYEHQQRLQRTMLDQNRVALRERARRERTLLRYRAYNQHAVDHLVSDLRTSVANGFEVRSQLRTLGAGYRAARTGQELTRLRGEILRRQQVQRSMARQVPEYQAQTSRMRQQLADLQRRHRDQLAEFARDYASLTPSGIAARVIRPLSQLQSVVHHQRSYSMRARDSYSNSMMRITSMSRYDPFGNMNQRTSFRTYTTTRYGR